MNSSTFVGGNIGNPLITKLDQINKESWVVLELSSFQLISLSQSPDIGIILNITPNHLDFHKTMKSYIDAKKNIFKYQNADDYIILNEDNEITSNFKGQTPSVEITYSLNKHVNRGVYLKKDKIYSNITGEEKEICDTSLLNLKGEHNISNTLAAFCAAVLAGASFDSLRSSISNFKGLKHRLEQVADKNGIKFYNDSVATTPESCMAALSSFSESVILIAGGYDKGLDYGKMAEKILKSVKTLILIGETKHKIKNAVKNVNSPENGEFEIFEEDSLKSAVIKAAAAAESGDVVLLSPGCASYDMFDNYRERGLKYKKLVTEDINL